MSFRTQPVRVANGRDEDGVLVFTADDRLVAILTRLTEQHDALAGIWFLEVGFGSIDGPNHPTFETLDAALAWITGRLRARTAMTSV